MLVTNFCYKEHASSHAQTLATNDVGIWLLLGTRESRPWGGVVMHIIIKSD